MELIDAVTGAEALAGRQLTATEMKLVQTVLSKGLSEEAAWDQIRGLLDVTTTAIVRRMTSMRAASAGRDNAKAAAALLREDAKYRMEKAGL